LTGGEPLLNPSVVDIVRNISEIPGIKQIGLTTNGFLLKEKLSELIKAGLNRLNVSLDSLEREKFCEVTGVDGLPQVLEGLRAARDSGAFQHVKINTVVMRGVNDSEVGKFAKWALENGFELRFIEYMPTRNTSDYADKYLRESDIRAKIDLEFHPDTDNLASAGPARMFTVNGYTGRIGFISALSQKFCESCNRLRLTADGRLIGCLFQDNCVDLIAMLRSGMSLGDLADSVRDLVSKPEFKDEADFTESGFRPEMKTIGG
jgi:GTP 3',8-cyclase